MYSIYQYTTYKEPASIVAAYSPDDRFCGKRASVSW